VNPKENPQAKTSKPSLRRPQRNLLRRGGVPGRSSHPDSLLQKRSRADRVAWALLLRVAKIVKETSQILPSGVRPGVTSLVSSAEHYSSPGERLRLEGHTTSPNILACSENPCKTAMGRKEVLPRAKERKKERDFHIKKEGRPINRAIQLSRGEKRKKEFQGKMTQDQPT